LKILSRSYGTRQIINLRFNHDEYAKKIRD